jgi:exopolysaccharide production protein ExoZ
MLRAIFEPAVAGKRIAAMEGMRGYAVLLVFLVHQHSLFGVHLRSDSWSYNFSELLQGIGHSGVDIFFLLSGFLIYRQVLSGHLSYCAFIAKRIRRIYPTFLAVFGMYIVTCFLVPSASKLPADVESTALYVVKNLLLLPGIADIQPLITVAWSLSYELFFYLFIPILVVATRMRRWRRVARILFFSSVLVLHCITYQLGWVPHIRLSMFTAGILLYEVMESGWRPRTSPMSEGFAVILYVTGMLLVSLLDVSIHPFTFHPHRPNVRFTWWTAALSFILPIFTFHCFAHDGVLKKVFSVTPARWLGNMSYSFFLLHGLVLNGIAFLLRLYLHVPLSGWLLLPLMLTNLLLAVSASAVLFTFVEKPFSFAREQAHIERHVELEPTVLAERSRSLHQSV